MKHSAIFIRGRDLRKRAGQALGPYFDRRDFHGALIAAGPVTLDLIRDRINQPFKIAA
jgi:uncharacterized protein (DUF885 family)